MNIFQIIFKRTAMILFWVGFALLVLFSPRLLKRFKSDDSVNIFMWSGVVDPKLFDVFEKETGIHVNVSYYEGNEELLVKLLATKGKGYDIVVPSDYIVNFLRERDLLKKLDKTKLDFLDRLNPRLMGHYFDPGNEYSIPSEWYLLGVGIHKKFFKGKTPRVSWDLLFDVSQMKDQTVVVNDSRELITLAMWYLFGEVRPLNNEEIGQVKDLLREQKRHIEAYSDFRGDFLLESGNCSVAVIPCSFAWQTAKGDPNIIFAIPGEGTFISIENWVIPKVSKKAEQVYQLMNFMFRYENQKHNFETQIMLPTTIDAEYLWKEPYLKEIMDYMIPGSDKNFMLFHNVLTDDQVNEIWLAVKGE